MHKVLEQKQIKVNNVTWKLLKLGTNQKRKTYLLFNRTSLEHLVVKTGFAKRWFELPSSTTSTGGSDRSMIPALTFSCFSWHKTWMEWPHSELETVTISMQADDSAASSNASKIKKAKLKKLRRTRLDYYKTRTKKLKSKNLVLRLKFTFSQVIFVSCPQVRRNETVCKQVKSFDP